VWTVPVVVIDERSQHPLEVPAVGDQDPVEALSADGADEALGDRVGLRRFDRGADDLDALGTEDLVERAAELGVVVADQEACRDLTLGELPDKVSRLLGNPGASGFSVMPARWMRRVEISMKKRT
jgi:hypothetical protein